MAGLKYVQVIGVDNVLNRLLCPLQIGFTACKNLEVSLKCCTKRSPEEKVGIFCKKDGKYDIVEYSELSQAQAEEKWEEDPSQLKFDLGSILIFMLDAQKLLSLCKDTAKLNEMYHVAHKKVAYYDQETKQSVAPTEPNAYKFELFLHNFLPMCSDGKVGALKVNRNEEFGPVKNADGPEGEALVNDSPSMALKLISDSNKDMVRALIGDNADKFDALYGDSVFEIGALKTYLGEGDNLKHVTDSKIVSMLDLEKKVEIL